MNAAIDMQTLKVAAQEPDEAQQKRQALAKARTLLEVGQRDPTPYPVEALGPLRDVCEVIADQGQLQPAMVGQCLLGAASLLTQGLFNVRTMAGIKPLSLYLLTLGDSGDGKSTADGAALMPIRQWQKEAGQQYRDDLERHQSEKASRKKGDEVQAEPKQPYRLCGDATVEGLRRDLDTGPMSQGMFTSEAAAVLSGYGMSAEHRAKTAAVFNALWDDGHLSVSRAVGGRVERYGRRLALHWLIQPSAAADVLGDPTLSSIGLWPRFMLAWPASSAPRKARPFRPDMLPEVGSYWNRCTELLSIAMADDGNECPLIDPDTGGQAIINAAFERFEQEGKRGGLKIIKPFALRATEQVCRVAGVLAAFGGHHTITESQARDALALVLYSLDAWRDVLDGGAADPTQGHAMRLYEWLIERPGQAAKITEVLRLGPSCVRSKNRRDAALEVLEGLGLVASVEGFLMARFDVGV